MKRLQFLALSLVTHIALLAIVVFFSKSTTKFQDTVVVELLPTNTAQTVATKSAGVGSKSKKSSAKSPSALLFGSSYTQDSKVQDAAFQRIKSDDYRNSELYQTGADHFIADTDQWSYFKQVFERIDQQLMFDSLLAQYNHFGDVFVEFEVDEAGHMNWNNVKVTAMDSILKVHALRALKKGVQEEFPKSKWNPDGKVAYFKAKFAFMQGSEDLNDNKQESFGKPILVFQRYTSEEPIPNTLQDQLLNGGVQRNVFYAVERWQKYNKKKKLNRQGFDPFSLYKSDPLYNL